MRIMHIGKYYHPRRGGMETVLRTMAEGLAGRGHAVTVVVAGDADDRGGAEDRAGVRVVRAWTPAVLNSQPVAPGLLGLLRRELARQAPAVVTLHLPHPLAAAACLALGLGGPGQPALAVWHHADITRQRLGRRLARPLQDACLARAARVATSSATHRDGSRELARWGAKTVVIPFGVAGVEPVVPADGGAFLFVGRLVRYKGLSVLLKALAELPDARLEVIGSGPEEGDLRRLASGLGLADRVAWLGALDETALERRLAAARALVLPSLDCSETFGVVQLEAMAAGVPVIASDLPTGVREVASPASHLLVPPGDAAALGRAMAAILSDPDAARRRGAAGRERQQALFGRGLMLDRLEAWYGAAATAGRT